MKSELFVIGLVSILGQVVILRELNVAFFGIELIYILAIGTWLLGTAAGATAFGRKLQPPRHGIELLLLGTAILFPLEVAFLRWHRVGFGGVAGAYLPFEDQLAALLLATFPVGLVLGLLFQWAAKRYCRAAGGLGQAYAVESLGGLLGGVVSFLFLWLDLPNLASALTCGIAAALPVVLRRPGRAISRLGSALILILGLLLFLTKPLDFILTGLNHPDLVASTDTPYGRITIRERDGQVTVFKDDVYVYESQETSAEELVHLAALQVDSPDRILVIGGGAFGILDEASKYLPQALDSFEIDARLVDLTREFLPRRHPPGSTLRAPLTRIGDPRTQLRESGLYDLLVVGISEPDSGQANRFFTREFFQLAGDHLSRGGVLALRLGPTSNVFTQARFARDGSIYHALTSVFSDVIVLPASSSVVLAGHHPLIRNTTQLEAVWRSRKIEARLVSAPYIEYLYNGDRFFEVNQRLSDSGGTPNSDLAPTCFRYSTLIWLSKLFPSLTNRQPTWPDFDSEVVAGLLLLLLGGGTIWVLTRRSRLFRLAVFMALTAAVGMFLETLLLLHYQTQKGALYRDLGLLLMMFMLGLAAGAGSVGKLLRGRSTTERRWGFLLSAGFIVLALTYLLTLQCDGATSLLLTALQLFGAGFMVSGVFAYCSHSGAQDERTLVSPLYAADLVGGFAATLIGSLVLIPFLGFELSFWAVLGVSLLAVLFV